MREFEYVPGKLNHRHLHAQTDAKERQSVFTGILNGQDFSIDTPVSKTWRYQESIQPFQFVLYIFGGNGFTVHILDNHFAFIDGTCMDESFEDRFIGILQLDVFSDQTDGNG